MIKAHFRVNKSVDNKKIIIEDVVGVLSSVSYRQIFENNSSDIHFSYVIINVGGVEYDLSKCTDITLTKSDGRTFTITQQFSTIRLDGVEIDPQELIRKLNTELF